MTGSDGKAWKYSEKMNVLDEKVSKLLKVLCHLEANSHAILS